METHKPHSAFQLKRAAFRQILFFFLMMLDIYCSLETKETADKVHLLSLFLRNSGAVPPSGAVGCMMGPARLRLRRGQLMIIAPSSSEAQSTAFFKVASRTVLIL